MDLSPLASNKASDGTSSVFTCRRYQQLNLKHMNPEISSSILFGSKLVSFSSSCRVCCIFRKICDINLINFDFYLLRCFTHPSYSVWLFHGPRASLIESNISMNIQLKEDVDHGLHRFSMERAMGNPSLDEFLIGKWILSYSANGLTIVQRTTKIAANHWGKVFDFQFAQLTISVAQVVQFPVDALYLTLSYVWGSQVRQQFIPGALPKALPFLIKDSITAAIASGYQYLWIDYYCIDQRNEQEVLDQISQMDIVYAASEATVIAATCANPSERLPGVRNGSRPSSQLVEIEGETYAVHYQIRNQSAGAWETRGWT